MFNDTDFGEDLLDLRTLLEREEGILEADEAPDDSDWEFVKQMRELRDQFFSPLEGIAENEPTLILDTYMGEWAENYAMEVTGVDTSEWPLNNIDWDAAAEDLAVDMSEVTVGEHTYFSRD